MGDANLTMMLKHSATVEAAATTIGSGLDPLSPSYVRGAGPVPALAQPLRGRLAETVLGKLPEATHVVYLEGGVQIAPGDALTVEAGVDQRRYEVLAVEDEGGQGHHVRVVVRAMEAAGG